MKSTADNHATHGSVDIRDMVDSDHDSVCRLILELFDRWLSGAPDRAKHRPTVPRQRFQINYLLTCTLEVP